jgi:hypothetical protein
MVSNGRAVGVVVPVFEEERFDNGVMLQNSNEFRSAVPPMSDDSDLDGQVIEYSSL